MSKIAHSYGVVDPRFIGIALRFYQLDTFLQCKELLEARCDPRRVLSLAEKTRLAGPESALDFVLMASAPIHEIRHFHDQLTTNWMIAPFRIRVDISIAALAVMLSAKSQSKWLPVPFLAWLKLPDEERNQIVTEAKAYGILVNSLDDVYFPDKHYMKLVDKIAKGFSDLKRWDESQDIHGGDFTSQAIIEASAVNVQLQDIYTAYGEKYCDLFWEELKLREENVYLSVLSHLISLVLSNKVAASFGAVESIIFWCLQENFAVPSDFSNPGNRFQAIYDAIDKGKIELRGNQSIQSNFTEWNRYFGLADFQDSLKEMKCENDDRISRLGAFPPKMQSLYYFLETAKQYFNESNRFISTIESDIDKYVHPYTYLKCFDNFPGGWFKYELESFCLPLPEDDPEKDILLLRGTRSKYGNPGALEFVPQTDHFGKPFISVEDCTEFYSLMVQLDYCFRESARTEPAFRVYKRLLTDSGVKILELP